MLNQILNEFSFLITSTESWSMVFLLLMLRVNVWENQPKLLSKPSYRWWCLVLGWQCQPWVCFCNVNIGVSLYFCFLFWITSHSQLNKVVKYEIKSVLHVFYFYAFVFSNSYSSSYYECLREESLHEGKESETFKHFSESVSIMHVFKWHCKISVHFSAVPGSQRPCTSWSCWIMVSFRQCLFATHSNPGLNQWLILNIHPHSLVFATPLCCALFPQKRWVLLI